MLLDITRQTPLLPQTSSEIKRSNLVEASDSASTLRNKIVNQHKHVDNKLCAAAPSAEAMIRIIYVYILLIVTLQCKKAYTEAQQQKARTEAHQKCSQSTGNATEQQIPANAVLNLRAITQ
jgi:hypothetical protein